MLNVFEFDGDAHVARREFQVLNGQDSLVVGRLLPRYGFQVFARYVVRYFDSGMHAARSVEKADTQGASVVRRRAFGHFRKDIGDDGIADLQAVSVEKCRIGILHPTGVSPQVILSGRQVGRQRDASPESQRVAPEFEPLQHRIAAVGQFHVYVVARAVVHVRDGVQQVSPEPYLFSRSVVGLVQVEIQFFLRGFPDGLEIVDYRTAEIGLRGQSRKGAEKQDNKHGEECRPGNA